MHDGSAPYGKDDGFFKSENGTSQQIKDLKIQIARMEQMLHSTMTLGQIPPNMQQGIFHPPYMHQPPYQPMPFHNGIFGQTSSRSQPNPMLFDPQQQRFNKYGVNDDLVSLVFISQGFFSTLTDEYKQKIKNV